jgi:hypothetical protein
MQAIACSCTQAQMQLLHADRKGCACSCRRAHVHAHRYSCLLRPRRVTPPTLIFLPRLYTSFWLLTRLTLHVVTSTDRVSQP